MDFQELIDYCQAEALANKLHPTDVGVYRQFCRSYSKLFSTPLAEVFDLPMVDVILHVYEEQLDLVNPDDSIEAIMDMIYTIEDPEHAKFKRDELKQFIKDAEREEEERQASGKPIHKSLSEEVSIKNSLLATPPPPEQKRPTGGSINLSYLEREESGGFDEES